MNKTRIKRLADFFYSSNTSEEVPLRIAVTFGMCGSDLTKRDFVALMKIFSYSVNLKEDLATFANGLDGDD